MNNNSKLVTVDGKFTAELISTESDGYLVQQLGTKRVDWYQRDRIRFWTA